MKKELIDQLKNGEVVLYADTTVEDLDKVLSAAFPEDVESVIYGVEWFPDYKYYKNEGINMWNGLDGEEIENNTKPVVNVSEVLGVMEQPFYTTEDGVDIKENQSVAWCFRDETREWKYMYQLRVCKQHLKDTLTIPIYKIFSTKQVAEDWCKTVNEITEKVSDVNGIVDDYKKSGIREFETGSRRDDDSDKPLVDHLDPYLRLRFGYLLRQGANKYDKGNWRKLQPTETALESLHRHLAKFELNLQHGLEQDEDHLSACIFNLMLIMKQEEKQGIAIDHFYGTMK